MKIHQIFSIRIDPSSSKDLKKKFAIEECEAIVCQTREIDQYFEKKKFKKSLIIKNPVTSEIVPSTKNNKEKFIAIGRLSNQKNFSMLIESFSLYALLNPKSSLTIFGSGENEKDLKKKILKLKNVAKNHLRIKKRLIFSLKNAIMKCNTRRKLWKSKNH